MNPTQATPTVEQLVTWLRENSSGLRPAERFKTVYRPKICPFDELLAAIPPGSRVVDIGCGGGSLLALIAQFCSPQALGGVELKVELLKRARHLLTPFQTKIRIELLQFDGVLLPPQIGDYDYVTLIDVLHHIPPDSQLTFLREVFSKMKRGAKLIFKDIDADRRFLCLMNKFHDLLSAGEIGHERSSSLAVDWLKTCGFHIESESKRRMVVYPHFTIICTKPA